jgi:hypothetical protein
MRISHWFINTLVFLVVSGGITSQGAMNAPSDSYTHDFGETDEQAKPKSQNPASCPSPSSN